MKIYLVRHPETKRNLNNQITGWEDSEYSEEGLEQFLKIKSYFKNSRLNVFSSDLPRAQKLAKEISEQNKTKHIIEKSLREQNFKETEPKEYFETDEEFEKRIFLFLEEINLQDSIIVAHEGTIQKIVKYIIGEEESKQIRGSRNIIFKIETIKKKKILEQIDIK